MDHRADRFQQVEDWLRFSYNPAECVTRVDDQLTAKLLATQAEWSMTTSEYVLRRLEKRLQTENNRLSLISAIPENETKSARRTQSREVRIAGERSAEPRSYLLNTSKPKMELKPGSDTRDQHPRTDRITRLTKK